MRCRLGVLLMVVGLSLVAVSRPARSEVEVVRFDLYKWQHRVGVEVARIDRGKSGTQIRAAFGFTDRSTTVPLSATWELAPDGRPRRFQLWGHTSRRSEADELVVVGKKTLAITEQGRAHTMPAPARFFLGGGYAPVIGTQELLRYWSRHDRPATLPNFPLGQLTIRQRGEDTVTTDDGKRSVLQRYALEGRSWGQETVWLDEQGALVAYKGIDAEYDPFEATRTGYSQALSGLVARAAADAIAALGENSRGLTASPASGPVVYAGARLIDGTGRPPVDDVAVVVNGGRIVAVGRRGQVEAPAGARTVELSGKTVLPGLWDMHAHFAQVEWGPVYLAAGVTTVRDCANELDFIRALRDTIDAGRGVGPRILLACLVDGEAEAALGNDRLRNRQQIPALIREFTAVGCTQVKVYSSLDPELIAPLAQAAHAAGMTVTGHVPEGIGPARAVEAGFDQINHIPSRASPASRLSDGVVRLAPFELADAETVLRWDADAEVQRWFDWPLTPSATSEGWTGSICSAVAGRARLGAPGAADDRRQRGFPRGRGQRRVPPRRGAPQLRRLGEAPAAARPPLRLAIYSRLRTDPPAI